MSGPADEREWLRESIAVRIDQYRKGHGWKPLVRHLYSAKNDRFPTGMLEAVIEKCGRAGVTLNVNESVQHAVDPSNLETAKAFEGLYPYQIEAVEAALRMKRGILAIATGGGKTRCAVAIMESIPNECLFLADEVSLINQASEVYAKVTGNTFGLISEGCCDIGPRVTFGTLQTVASRKKNLHEFLASQMCVIFDEVHVLGARSFWKVGMSLPNAEYRIGLSATPRGRSDKLDDFITAVTGPVIYQLGITELTRLGKLAENKIIFYAYSGASNVGAREWHNIYSEGVVYCRARNEAVRDICRITPKPILIFFDRKAHGRILRDILEDEFVVDLVSGKSSGIERSQASKGLDSGRIEVLLASKIFNKGVDIPKVRSCINAAGTKATITSIQRLGRGLRKVTGEKEKLVFWDLHDTNDPILERHSREKKQIYEELGQRVFLTRSLEKAVEWMNLEVKKLRIR